MKTLQTALSLPAVVVAAMLMSACASTPITTSAPTSAPQATSVGPASASRIDISPAEARAIAQEAYVYGYPLVENYKTMWGFSVDTQSPLYSGFNKYQHNRKLYDPDFKLVVTPNNDTLYSTTFADLRAEPLVIRVPPAKGRYYVVQLIDYGSDNLAYIGTRETGDAGGTFLLVGPNFKGTLPPSRFDRVIVAPTPFMAIPLRTSVSGADDIAGATAFQDQVQLIPLSRYLGTAAPPVPPAINFPPWDTKRAESIAFFEYLDTALNWYTPRLDEAPLFQRMARLAILPGGVDGFSAMRFSPEVQAALAEGMAAGAKQVEERSNQLGKRVNGWEYTPPMGHFGTDYLFRAAVARKFMYTHDPEEALYPIANVDAEGNALKGKYRYVLRFPKGSLPPADAFWSVTLYDTENRLLVHNDLRRYSIGDRTPGLKADVDGALTLYIQRESPGKERESNWLPAPMQPFYLIMRAYMPRAEMRDGSYRIPPVRKVP